MGSPTTNLISILKEIYVSKQNSGLHQPTVDGRNSAPVDMENILLFTKVFINSRWLGMGFLNHQQ